MFISSFRQGLLAALALPFATCFAADTPADYQWVAFVAPAQTLEIRLINGSIRVDPADGPLVEVSAWKTGSRPDPASVQIETIQQEGGLLIRAVYPSELFTLPNSDLKIDFVVRIPAGVKFRGSAINGSLDMRLKDNPASADLVNGRISTTTQAALEAHMVNGSIDATLGNVMGKNDLRVVNGTVEARLASTASAAVHAQILFGPITSDFPLSMRRFLVGNSADGVLGAGDGALQISAVSGKIAVLRAPETEPQP